MSDYVILRYTQPNKLAFLWGVCKAKDEDYVAAEQTSNGAKYLRGNIILILSFTDTP